MTEERRERILALCAKGYTGKAIAELVGIAESTVSRTLSPTVAEKSRLASRQWKARNRAYVLEANRVYDAHRRKRAEMPYVYFLRELRDSAE